MTKKIVMMLSLFAVLAGVSACANTVDGAGKDIERAGENIQRSVNN